MYCPSSTTLSKKEYVCDSEEEYYFAKWVRELMDAGYIDIAYRPNPLKLSKAIMFQYLEERKRKPKTMSLTLQSIGTYTPDMYLEWTEKAYGIFYVMEGDLLKGNINPQATFGKKYYMFFNNFLMVDVKGTGKNMKHHSSSSFDRIKQLYTSSTGLYVSKVVPLGAKGLFAKTFAPKEYFYTTTGKMRNPFTWKLRTLQQFLDGFESPVVASTQQSLFD